MADMHGDALGIIYSVLLIGACLGLSFAVTKFGGKRLGEARSEVARKIVHIGVSNWFFIYAYIFEGDVWPIVGLAAFAVINAVLNVSGLLAKIMAQESTKRNWGLVQYPISIILLILVRKAGFGDLTAFGCAVLGMGYGDGLASLVGRHVKSPKLWKDSKKTVAGSVTMATVTFIVVLIMKTTYGNAGMETALLSAAACSVAATLVEAVTPFGLDNISVPLTIYLIAGLL
ncbi:MAG: hypothetical protein IKP61_10890 [Spirochaetales bacterium]|nr:hypothetical protein [Spirochaetales bacterium]